MTTGYLVRIHRGGAWLNLDVAELTDDELETWAARGMAERPTMGWAWAKSLAAWVRDHVREDGPPVVEVAHRDPHGPN